MVVDVSITTSLSDTLYKLISGSRLLNQYAKAAMAAELIKHHNLRIPWHFKAGARARYQYQHRKESTEDKKERYWRIPRETDLVRSGRSERAITGPGYTLSFRGAFGGATAGGSLQGRLNMFLPYSLSNKYAKVGGITPEEVVSEIVRVTDDEADDIARGYVARIVNQINAYAGPMRFLRKTGKVDTGRKKPSMGVSPFTKRGKPIGPAPGGIFKSGAYGPGF